LKDILANIHEGFKWGVFLPEAIAYEVIGEVGILPLNSMLFFDLELTIYSQPTLFVTNNFILLR